MKKPKKTKRRWSVLIGLLLIAFTLLFLMRSQNFWRYALKSISASIPGYLEADVIKVNLETGKIHVQNLVYLRNNNPVMTLEEAHLNLTYGYSLRGILGVASLRAKGLEIDQRYLPKRDTPISWRNVLKFVLKHIIVEDGILEGFKMTLRNGHVIETPEIHLTYKKKIFRDHYSQIKTEKITYRVHPHLFHAEQLTYEGTTELSTLYNYTYVLAQAKGTLKILALKYDERPLFNLEGTLFVDGDEIGFKESFLDTFLGDFTLKGSLHQPDKMARLKLSSQKSVEVEKIPKLSKHIRRLLSSADIALETHIQNFDLKNMKGYVDLTLNTHGNSVNPNNKDQKLHIVGQMKKGKLDLRTFEITSPLTQLSASGTIDFANQILDTKIKASKVDVATLMAYFSDIEIGGMSTAEGTIRGHFSNPEFKIQNQAEHANYSALHFGPNTGNLEIHNKTLSYNASSSARGAVHFQVKMNHLFSKTDRQGVLNTQFSDVDTTALLENPFLKGRLSGNYQMDILPGGGKKGSLQANVKDFFMYYFHVGDMGAEGVLNNNQFTLSNTYFSPPNHETIRSPGKTIFDFTPEVGFDMVSNPVIGIQMKGKYLYSRPQVFETELDLQHFDLRLFQALLEYPQFEAYTDAKIKLNAGIGPGTLNDMEIYGSRFLWPLEDSEIREAGPLHFTLKGNRFNFLNAKFKSEGEVFSLGGSFVPQGPLAMNLDGRINLAILRNIPSYFREGSGIADVHLQARGTWNNPSFQGKVDFLKSGLTLRAFRGIFENITGQLSLVNNVLYFQNFKANIAEGDIQITGNAQIRGLDVSHYNLKFLTQEVALSDPGTYKMIFSGDFDLKGPSTNATLSGTVNVTDGKYHQKFSIAESFLKPEKKIYVPQSESPFDNIRLNLKVRSPGELTIKNNLAEIFLKSDLNILGTVKNPYYTGTLQVLEGDFHYFNIAFENARGFIEFREKPQKAYIDMRAERLFERFHDTIIVSAHVQGFSDNPQLTFRSNPPMPRKDIINLLFTGTLPGERHFLSRGTAASSVLGSSLTTLFGGPVEQFTKLDIFRMEANDPEEEQVSSLVIGKRLTDRLTLEFKTELNRGSGLRTVQMEYQLLDNILVRASGSSGNRFKLDVTFRWKLY